MPEQLGPEQLRGTGRISELDILRGVIQSYYDDESKAAELTRQADEIREMADREARSTWKETKAIIQESAETGELAGKDLLRVIIDFRNMTPEKLRSQGNKSPARTRRGLGFTFPTFDKDVILATVDQIEPGEPVIVDNKVGIIQAEPRTSVLDNLSALGAYVHVDVAFKPGEIREIKKSISGELGELTIGQVNIQSYIDGLYYNTNPNPRIIRSELKHNLEKLKTIRQQVSELEGFDFDLSHLDKQIASGEWSQARIREHRAHRSRLQRALDPI